ncbi:hypothetical protein HZA96_01540 [Candidatus Woesearchaeota archaeon]|nr:hypothetical protein [Candidatus Woesearchaeota archaeon]
MPIAETQIDLPFEVEQRVADYWKSFVAEKPKAADNPVSFLLEYNRLPQGIEARVHLAGYRYNQYFNRDDYYMRDTASANLGFNPLASWIIATCENGRYALFGNKIDFGANVIGGFGGFTSNKDVQQNADGSREINVDSYLTRMIQQEMGEISKALGEKQNIGLNFMPYVAPRGSDGVYHISLDGTKEQLMRLMTANDQMSSKLIAVEATPDKLVELLLTTEQDPSTSFFGGVFSFIGSKYGTDELNKYLARYNTAGNKRVDVKVLNPLLDGNVYERIKGL